MAKITRKVVSETTPIVNDNIAYNNISVDELRLKLEEQQKQISMLMKAADKNKMSIIANKEKLAELPKYNMSLYNGLVVTSWRTIANEVESGSSKVFHVDQRVEITLEDDTTVTLTLVEFVRKLNQTPKIERLSLEETHEGVFVTLPYNDKEYRINLNFLNN